MVIAVLAPMAVQVTVSRFAPPIDRPLTMRISEVRVDGTRTQRFAIDRRVTFTRDGDGFVAAVETLAVTGDAGRAGPLFEAMARSLQGRRVILHLDAAGAVTDVEDLDALWAAQLDAMAAMLPRGDAARDATTAALLAPLRSLAGPARIARMADLIAPMIATGTPVPAASRAITVPARAHDGTTALLAGTERTTLDDSGVLHFERRAGGVVSGVPTSILIERRIDPRTHMIVESVSTSTTDVADTRQIVTRTTSVAP